MPAETMLARRRLNILHYNRARNEEIEREVSPQRLVHYRDNWYLDAWCHLREGVRCFALESIRRATLLDAPARNVSEAVLNEELGNSYGIFTGKADNIAKLRFTPERARWVGRGRDLASATKDYVRRRGPVPARSPLPQ